MKLSVSDVYPNPDQPRKHFDAAALAELGASIRQNGLLQPITVVRRPLGPCHTHMILAGERRWRATKAEGFNMIECNIVEASDDELEIGAIVENLQRSDISPLEEARAFKRMVDTGYTPESLAERLGLKQPHRVRDRLQLFQLRPEYLDLLEHNTLTPSQAFELSRLDLVDQGALFSMISSGRCNTYPKLRAAADGILFAKAQNSMFDEAPKPSESEIKTLSKFERMVERLVGVCNDGIRENEVVVLRKIDPNRAGTIVQQLGLIRNDLARMEQALQHAAAQGTLQTA